MPRISHSRSGGGVARLRGLLAVLCQPVHPAGPVKNLAAFTTPVNFRG